MKRGLHLGRKPPRTRALVLVVLAALVAALALQGARWLEIRRSGATLQAELAAIRARAPGEPVSVVGGTSLAHLHAVVASGALTAFPPTAVLDLLSEALPDGVVVSAVSIQPSPPAPSLTVEAVAGTAEAVTELQRRMDASPLVRATTVLDERRARDGELALRLQVDLDRGELP